MIQPNIKLLSSEELEKVASLWLESSIDAHSFIPASYWRSKVDEMKKVWLPGSETWLLKVNEEILGFYSIVNERLAAIFLKPSAQGQGYGRMLMDHAKSRRNRIELTVYEKNRPSIRFYERSGFKIIRSGIDEATGEPELLMKYEPDDKSTEDIAVY